MYRPKQTFFKLIFFFIKEDFDNEKFSPDYRISFSEKPQSLTTKEYELLYIETLYTIKHKIGTATSKYSEGENDLYAYAQEAFGLSNENHQRLLNKANEEKVCFKKKDILTKIFIF
jgi:hypothetical protein